MEIEEVAFEAELDLLDYLTVPPKLTAGAGAVVHTFSLRKMQIRNRLTTGLFQACDQVVSCGSPGELLTAGFKAARGLGPSDRVLFVRHQENAYLFWTERTLRELSSLRERLIAECAELRRDVKVAEAVEYVHSS